MNKRHLLAGLCISLLPLSAEAVPVTYEFSGQVTMAMADGEIDPLTWVPFVPFGTLFTGSFTYETETPIAFSAQGILGYNNPVTAATMSFGANGEFGVFEFLAGPSSPSSARSSSIAIINDSEFNGNPPYDQFSMSARMGALPADPAGMYRFLSFGTGDYSAQSIPPGQTLLDPLPMDSLIAGFHQLTFGYTLFGENGEYLDEESVGSQSISMRLVPASVPEPATLGLLLAGLVAGCLARRRRTFSAS